MIKGEETYRMPTLGVPQEADHLNADEAGRSTAVALFAERALSADKRFKLTDENAPIVADICRRLDGIALAIELAASRVKILSPYQLRERLDERFRVLTGGSRDVLPRQQTLRALIDWSYDLLDDKERVLFRRLGIFVNGFTLEGAVAVGGGEDFDEIDVFDVLASLVDKSLVLAEPNGNSLRYRLLESTRAYAVEKLDAAGERSLVAARHLRYFGERFAELSEEYRRSGRPAEMVATFGTELEDVRFALDEAMARSAVVEGSELLSAIDRFWTNLGLDNEGILRCEQCLAALSSDEPRLLANLKSTLALMISQTFNTMRALPIAMEAVAHGRASGDADALADALRTFGSTAINARRFEEAEAALAEAEAIPGRPRSFRFNLLIDRAYSSDLQGDWGTAATAYEQLRKEQRALGNVRGELVAAGNLAEAEHGRGNTQRAVEIVYEILPALRSGKDKALLEIKLTNLAGYLVAMDDLPGAGAVAREAIGIYATQEPDRVMIALGIEHLALVSALGGDLLRAARTEGYVDALLRRKGAEREPTETTTYNRLMAQLGEALAPDELERLLAEGAALTPESAIALALEDSHP